MEALKQLKKRYKLVILSNVDKASFAQVLKGALAGIDFDAVYVAEEIGSYKPDLKNFQYLVTHARNELGVQMEQILMTAHGLESDHVPAMKMGMTSAVSIPLPYRILVRVVDQAEGKETCASLLENIFRHRNPS